MDQILNLFAGIIRHFVDLNKAEAQANWTNDDDTEERAKKISTEDVLESMDFAVPVEDFYWPVNSRPPRVTSPFGYRTLNVDGRKKRSFHTGVDLIGNTMDVIAPEDMIVKKILKPDPKYPCRFKWNGRTWETTAPAGRAWTPYIITVGEGSRAWFSWKHVKPRGALKPGDRILAGTVFATYGNYGYSMGAHLHAECWPWVEAGGTYRGKPTKWPKPTDPMKFWEEGGAR